MGDMSVAAASARDPTMQAATCNSPPLALATRSRRDECKAALPIRTALPQAESSRPSTHRTVGLGMPSTIPAADSASGSRSTGHWREGYRDAPASGGRTSRPGGETKDHEAPTVRSNVWSGSISHDALAKTPQTGSSRSSTRTKAGSGTGSSDKALPVLFFSAPTSLASDLEGMPDLEMDTSDYGGHVELSSGSSSGHLDMSSLSGSDRLSSNPSLGATPQAPPVQEAEDGLEQVYKMAERTISAAYWDHDKFKSGYYEVKEAMTDAGRVDVARLGSLLAREEEAIRRAYGRSKWQSLNMDYGVDAYTASRIHGARNSTLAWIKSEQKSMGLPSKKGSMARLKSWASDKFSKHGGKPEVPTHRMEIIAEDDETA